MASFPVTSTFADAVRLTVKQQQQGAQEEPEAAPVSESLVEASADGGSTPSKPSRQSRQPRQAAKRQSRQPRQVEELEAQPEPEPEPPVAAADDDDLSDDGEVRMSRRDYDIREAQLANAQNVATSGFAISAAVAGASLYYCYLFLRILL